MVRHLLLYRLTGFAAIVMIVCSGTPILVPSFVYGDNLTLDQSFIGPQSLGADINECCRFIAQTFTAGLTGTLGGIKIEVQSFFDTFPLHISIRTVTNGIPNTTILGETTLAPSIGPILQLITFPQVIHIFAGVQYAIVVNYAGAPPPGPGQSQGTWLGEPGDQYNRGTQYFSFLDSISWNILTPGADLHFQTYVYPVIPVDIDIKPGSDDNCININGNGVIPVAVLGSDDFDVTQIDVGTLDFAGLAVRVRGNDNPQCSIEDVSGDFTTPEGAPDGYLDLVCQFVDNPMSWSPGDGTATLTGELLDGTPFEGMDSICIVP